MRTFQVEDHNDGQSWLSCLIAYWQAMPCQAPSLNLNKLLVAGRGAASAVTAMNHKVETQSSYSDSWLGDGHKQNVSQEKSL